MYNDIPPEILLKIFQYLLQRDIIQCQKVCKLWYLSTRQLLWKDIQLRTEEHVDLFLKCLYKDVGSFIKKLVIGDQINYPLEECVLEKEQLKQLLFNLPNVEEIIIEDPFSSDTIIEINDKEFLNKFRERCPKVKLFEVRNLWNEQQQDIYIEILHSIGLTLKKVTIGSYSRDESELAVFFPQLEELNTYISFDNNINDLGKSLVKVMMLPQLKSLCLWIQNFDQSQTYKNSWKKHQDLQEKLGSLERLKLRLQCDRYTPKDLRLISQNFTGLKEIEIIRDWSTLPVLQESSEDLLLYNEWLEYVCSHNRYKMMMFIKQHDIDYKRLYNIFNVCLQNNFNHLHIKGNSVRNHLRVAFDDSDILEMENSEDYPITIALQIESKKTSNNQHLKISSLSFRWTESVDSSNIIKNILLDPVTSVLKDTDVLTIEVNDLEYKKQEKFPFNTFTLVDKILSLTSTSLKKVILFIKSSSTEWCKHFVRYEKVKVYRQVSHLEIYIDIKFDVNSMDLSQFSIVFPCIKYLTLQFYNMKILPVKNSLSIDLSQFSLKRLTLDVSTIKRLAQISKIILENYFILEVKTDKDLYYYQVSLDSLTIIKSRKNEQTGILYEKNHLNICIILKNIQCLEMRLLDNDTNMRWMLFGNQSRYNNLDFKLPEKLYDRRIYFN